MLGPTCSNTVYRTYTYSHMCVLSLLLLHSNILFHHSTSHSFSVSRFALIINMICSSIDLGDECRQVLSSMVVLIAGSSSGGILKFTGLSYMISLPN